MAASFIGEYVHGLVSFFQDGRSLISMHCYFLFFDSGAIRRYVVRNLVATFMVKSECESLLFYLSTALFPSFNFKMAEH